MKKGLLLVSSIIIAGLCQSSANAWGWYGPGYGYYGPGYGWGGWGYNRGAAIADATIGAAGIITDAAIAGSQSRKARRYQESK